MFPDDVVNSNVRNKAIAPGLPRLLSILFKHLSLLEAFNISKFKSKKLFNREIVEISLGLLIFIRNLAVFIVLIADGDYLISSLFKIFLLISLFSFTLNI